MNIYEFILNTLPKNALIVEVGSHHAEDAERMLDLLPESTVIGFEADPRCINIIQSKQLERFQLFPLAIGDYDGEVDWYTSDGVNFGWDHSSSILPPKLHLSKFPGIQFQQKHTVQQTTLDTIFSVNNLIIDFMWIDVQGAEYYVFKGGLDTLKKTKYIWFECYDKEEVYEGAKTLDEIMALLPDWAIIGQNGDDYLIANTRLLNG